MDAVIEVSALRKAYGSVRAVDGVDLTLRRGEIVGVVGPNGAGKTTMLECVAGIRRPDSGVIRVLGLDPLHDRKQFTRRVSLQPQAGALFGNLTVRESVRLWCSFYPQPRDVDDLIAAVGLTEKADARVKRLSGGQYQRLRLVLALAGSCEILLLDEPTGALDPNAREDAWSAIRARGDEQTVVVTTHSMEEAEQLCDRVVIIDRGRVVADGTPSALMDQHGGQTVSFRLPQPPDEAVLRRFPGVKAVLLRNHGGGALARLVTDDPARTSEKVRARYGATAKDVHVAPNSLHTVFVTLTGTELKEVER